jgi:acetyl-CoA acyltransferase
MPEAVIVDAIRTPIGALGGSLSSIRPDDLAALVLKALLERNPIPPAEIEEVYLGCANQAGEDNRNVARMSSLLAGIPPEVPGVTINRLCASGLTAVNLAASAINAGIGDIYLAGGVESMSRAPYSLPKADRPFSFGNMTAWDTSLGWRYPNPIMMGTYGADPMGETAENIAVMKGITRQEQDSYAVESHRRAITAMDAGRFSDEILPVQIHSGKTEPIIIASDDRPRRNATLESLAHLKPAFRRDGTVTAGNSTGMNDGAAALTIMSTEKAQALGIKPLVKIISSAAAGVLPKTMGLGPIPATQKALKRANLTIRDIALAEVNEAFAVQVLAVISELKLDSTRTNVNGGAIALGHPLGCSGARILTTLVHEMKRRASLVSRPFYGLATLCVGVGQGEATIVEWLD